MNGESTCGVAPSQAPGSVQCSVCKAITAPGNGCSAEDCPVGVTASAAPSIKPEPRKATLMLPVYIGNVKSGRIADAVSAALLDAGIEVDRIEVGMPRPDGVDLPEGTKHG